MKTIQIESEFDSLFVAHQVWAYTKKGEIPYGCPSTSKNYIKRKSDDLNKKVPFFCDIYKTTIYETYVRELTITVRDE